jgi:hypothetical protein
MALAERVTPEQAAVVFRRAAELQTSGVTGEVAAVLDETALEEIGREVGLSPASIQAALAELRSDVVLSAPAPTWGTVVRSRTVHADRSAVLNVLDDQARQNLLVIAHRAGDTTVWSPHPGPAAALVRGLRGRRRYPLLALKELRATVSDTDTSLVRVCLEGSLRFPLTSLSARSQTISVLGIGTGAFLAFGVDGLGHTDWALDATGALIALCGTAVGLRAYRRAIATAENALARVLDRVTYEVLDLPPWPQPFT